MTTTLSGSLLRDAIGAAVRAPSMHNTQPWRFRIGDNQVDVTLDPDRVLAVADPSGWAARLACGAAAFNLRLALAVMDLDTTLVWQPDPRRPDLMARVAVTGPRPATPVERRLAAAIPRRRSNRQPFWPDPVAPPARTALIDAAAQESAWLELLTGAWPVGIISELTQTANRMLNRDDAYRAELRAWSGASPGQSDGVPSAAAAPEAQPQDLFPQRPFGGEERTPGHDYEPEPLVGILGTFNDAPVDQLAAGAALQRVLLTATDLGLATSMLSQPIEVPTAREQLRAAVRRRGYPQMVLRIGFGQPGPASTPRRALDDVIDHD